MLHEVDHRLFGRFLERASWGEPGPEAALVPGTRQLQPSVEALLQEMRPPLIRFPGGTDADYLDWRDMVDAIPGREPGRPVSRTEVPGSREITNGFGYDEFLQLCERLGTDPLLVVNFRNALLGRMPLEEAANHAAGLLAYAAAPLGAALPAGMPDWPALRAANGRAKPYRVPYVQIGNETWFFWDQLRAEAGSEAGAVAWYVECLAAYAEALRAVAPEVTLIVDGQPPTYLPAAQERLGDALHYVVHHYYTPWRIGEVTRNGQTVPVAELSARDIWYAWLAVPGIDPVTGESALDNEVFAAARRMGLQVAETEWNWNGGWWGHRDAPPGERPALDSLFAKGLGAAGILHALLRAGDVVALACQSMLVGAHWDINAIRVDPTGREAAYTFPNGQITTLYSQHHGTSRLAMESREVPTYEQPFSMGGLQPCDRVALVDALATGDERKVYWHAINRHFDEDIEVVVELEAGGEVCNIAAQHLLEGRLHNEPREREARECWWQSVRTVQGEGGVFRITLPKRSVSIVEVERR